MERHELLRPDGECVPLLGKPEEVLLALLTQPRVTVSRDELSERVWPGVVTTEASLRRAVYLLRQALGGEGHDSVVVTVRGRGYRLDASVQTPISPDTDPLPGGEPLALPALPLALPAPPPPRRRWRRLALAACGVLLVGLLVSARPIHVELPESWPEAPPLARPATSVAVLPFADGTGDGAHAHLAEGLTRAIIRRLAGVPTLQVVGAASSFALAPDTDVGEAGARLGAGSVVLGRVREEGERVHIEARLVRVADGSDVLFLDLELDAAGALPVRDEIAERIASALADGVAEASPVRLRTRHPPDPRAYDHFLRGSTTQHYRSREGAIRTVEHFEQAVALDAGFAEAWAELSRALARFAFHVRDDPARYRELLQRADRAAYRALELVPESGLALAAVAGVLNRRADHAGAVEWLRRAVELEPGYAALLEYYATNLVRVGRLEEAHEQLARLVERDPLSPLAHRQLGRIHLYLGQPELAIRSLLRCLELNPRDEDAPRLLADAYVAQGRELEAGEMFIRLYPWPLRGPARAGLRVLGMPKMAWIAYRVLRWQTGDLCLKLPYDAAGILAVAGERDLMFACLESAPITTLTYFDLEPVFAPYRDDPRFVRLIERAGRRVPHVEAMGPA